MKLLKLYFIITIFSITLNAQLKSVSPSFYFTNGNYSNDISSNEYSGYAKLTFGISDYVVAGYSNLLIENTDWDYKQNLLVIGGYKNLFPYLLRGSFGYAESEFSFYPPDSLNIYIPLFIPANYYDYKDKILLFNIDALRNVDVFYFGLSYTYFNLNVEDEVEDEAVGFTRNSDHKPVSAHQAGIIFNWVINPKLTLSVRPYYNHLNDGRRLFSTTLGINYSPLKNILISAEATEGNRAYFYDTEYLTLFNQDQTQSANYKLRVSYTPIDILTLTGSFIYSDFNSYNIKYLSAGVKFNFPVSN